MDGDGFERSVTPGGLRIDPAALSWQFSRSSGPGGQHVNRTESRVELRCDLDAAGLPEAVRARLVDRLGASEVRVTASEHRSQRRNRELAWERLAERVDALAKPERKRRPTKRTRGSNERRLEAKRQESGRKTARRWRPSDE